MTSILSGSRRAAAGIAAASLALISLAACSSTSDDEPTDGATGGAEISADGVDDGSTLTLWTRAPLEQQANLLVDAYNASHENQVELTVVPNDDYVAKVGAAAGGGSLPDLFAADIVYVPNWVQQGLFQDISANIDALPYKDEINKGHLSAGTYEGSEHVLPFVLDLSMLFWNKELFEEAGLDPEVAPANMQEYADAAKAVQALDKEGVYGTATGLQCGGCLVFTWFPSIWADGEEVLSDDGMESLLASDTAKEVYSTWNDLWESGAVLPSSESEAGPTWTAAFTEGNVGLMQAVKRFDPDKGFRLATYAMWWIRASIQEYILRSWSLVKMGTTAAQKKLFFNLRRAKGQLQALEDGDLRPEHVEKIATRLGVSQEDVISMNRRLGGDASLNAPLRADAESGGEWQDWLIDDTPDQEQRFAESEELDRRRSYLVAAMDDLNDRERRIFEARRLAEDPITLEELSTEFGVSRERIRQIEVRAFEKVQKAVQRSARSDGLATAPA